MSSSQQQQRNKRKQLLTWSKPKLIKEGKKYNLRLNGTKNDMINNLLKVMDNKLSNKKKSKSKSSQKKSTKRNQSNKLKSSTKKKISIKFSEEKKLTNNNDETNKLNHEILPLNVQNNLKEEIVKSSITDINKQKQNKQLQVDKYDMTEEKKRANNNDKINKLNHEILPLNVQNNLKEDIGKSSITDINKQKQNNELQVDTYNITKWHTEVEYFNILSLINEQFHYTYRLDTLFGFNTIVSNNKIILCIVALKDNTYTPYGVQNQKECGIFSFDPNQANKKWTFFDKSQFHLEKSQALDINENKIYFLQKDMPYTINYQIYDIQNKTLETNKCESCVPPTPYNEVFVSDRCSYNTKHMCMLLIHGHVRNIFTNKHLAQDVIGIIYNYYRQSKEIHIIGKNYKMRKSVKLHWIYDVETNECVLTGSIFKCLHKIKTLLYIPFSNELAAICIDWNGYGVLYLAKLRDIRNGIENPWSDEKIKLSVEGLDEYNTFVLNDKIILVYGGWCKNDSKYSNDIYYLDVSDNSRQWKLSSICTPTAGNFQAVQVGDIVHFIQLKGGSTHYSINVTDLLNGCKQD